MFFILLPLTRALKETMRAANGGLSDGVGAMRPAVQLGPKVAPSPCQCGPGLRHQLAQAQTGSCRQTCHWHCRWAQRRGIQDVPRALRLRQRSRWAY